MGDGPMFGQNGLLYDSNVVGVLAARGLERNSFPSHSFSWHLSPSPTADPPSSPSRLDPTPLSLPPPPRPRRFAVPTAREFRSLQQTVTANCHMAPGRRASLSPCPDGPDLFPVQT